MNICQYPWLSHDQKCDVLIIGSGVTGSMIFHSLLEQDKNLNVIMMSQYPVARSTPSYHTAVLQYQNEYLVNSKNRAGSLNKYMSYENALNQIESLEESIGKFGFKRRDSLMYSNNGSKINELHHEYLLRRHNGFDVEFVEQADCMEKFSFMVKGGILAKNQSAEIDGYRLCHKLIARGERLGGKIYENTAITDLYQTDGGITALTEYDTIIEAKKVIVSTNTKLIDRLSLPVQKRTAYTIISKPMKEFTGFSGRTVCYDIDEDVSVYATPCNRLVATGQNSAYMNISPKIAELIGSDRLKHKKFLHLEQFLYDTKISPQQLEIDKKVSYSFAITKENMPIFQQSQELENLYYTLPTGVHGILQSFMLSKMAVKVLA